MSQLKFFELEPGFAWRGSEYWFIDFPPEVYAAVYQASLGDRTPAGPLKGIAPPGMLYLQDYMYSSDGLLRLFSERLSLLVESLAPASMRFWPFSFRVKGSRKHIHGYLIGECANIVDCIDRTKTRVRDDQWLPMENGLYHIVPPYWLIESRIADERVFGVEGSNLLIVRHDVKDAIIEAKMTGCAFSSERIHLS